MNELEPYTEPFQHVLRTGALGAVVPPLTCAALQAQLGEPAAAATYAGMIHPLSGNPALLTHLSYANIFFACFDNLLYQYTIDIADTTNDVACSQMFGIDWVPQLRRTPLAAFIAFLTAHAISARLVYVREQEADEHVVHIIPSNLLFFSHATQIYKISWVATTPEAHFATLLERTAPIAALQ